MGSRVDAHPTAARALGSSTPAAAVACPERDHSLLHSFKIFSLVCARHHTRLRDLCEHTQKCPHPASLPGRREGWLRRVTNKPVDAKDA